MTDNQKEAIERLNLHKELAQINNDCCIVNVKDVGTVLKLIQTQQAEIENYKKQKIYDKQIKHELLEEIKCKGLTIDSLNKILDDRLICIQGGRGLYAKLKGLDKEYLIREYLSMYKICKEEIEKYKYLYQKALDNTIKSDRELLDKKAELEKKDKVIDKLATFVFMSRNLTYVDEKQFNARKREIIEQAEKQVVKEVKRK